MSDGREDFITSVSDEGGTEEKGWVCKTGEKSSEMHELEEAAKPVELSSVGRIAELEGGRSGKPRAVVRGRSRFEI